MKTPTNFKIEIFKNNKTKYNNNPIIKDVYRSPSKEIILNKFIEEKSKAVIES